MEKGSIVCVTGGAGYLGSWLVKSLLEKGHTVHATLRNLDDPSKTKLLQSLPGADTRLKLFMADIYSVDGFEPAISGCEFVFHLATPMIHNPFSTKHKDTTEAAIAGVKSIVEYCIRSRTVKRLIYTASVTSASPLKDDCSGFKDSMDESCWTPLHHSFPCSTEWWCRHVCSKTQSEKELLSYCNKDTGGLEVVTLACGLVGGRTLLPYLSGSLEVTISQLTGNKNAYTQLKWLEELLGSVPLLHIDDFSEAHLFCMNKPSMSGRFLCASAYPTAAEIAKFYRENYPEIDVENEYKEGPEKGIKNASTKLIGMGFEYKHEMESILEDSVECARKMGVLK
ncbi:NADPH HC-toxin reductase 1-like [Tasmannia lanceolata]|uniref:NADPH HC-toxin reductase 1-like n=1 Tax=Tasmannia lanceolata TaxID=3420 RepID=UPI004063925F